MNVALFVLSVAREAMLLPQRVMTCYHSCFRRGDTLSLCFISKQNQEAHPLLAEQIPTVTISHSDLHLIISQKGFQKGLFFDPSILLLGRPDYGPRGAEPSDASGPADDGGAALSLLRRVRGDQLGPGQGRGDAFLSVLSFTSARLPVVVYQW